MGSALSEVMTHDARVEVKEALMMMEKLLDNKMQAIHHQLEQKVSQDTDLPIVAIVQRVQRMSISVENVDDADISDVVDNIFGGKWMDGLKRLVTTGLDVLLGNATAGEKENTGFSVIFSNNSLLRVDYYMYKYDLTNKQIVQEMSNGFLYFVQISVLDLEKVNPQVVLYELSKSVGRDSFADITKELKSVEAFAKELYGTIKEMTKAVSADSDEAREENRQEGVEGF